LGDKGSSIGRDQGSVVVGQRDLWPRDGLRELLLNLPAHHLVREDVNALATRISHRTDVGFSKACRFNVAVIRSDDHLVAKVEERLDEPLKCAPLAPVAYLRMESFSAGHSPVHHLV